MAAATDTSLSDDIVFPSEGTDLSFFTELNAVRDADKKKRKSKRRLELASKKEILAYFSKIRNDPNVGILCAPMFVQREFPEVYAGCDRKTFEEKMKRMDYVERMKNAKTPEERQVIIEAERKRVNETVPAYSKIPIPDKIGIKG